MRIGIEVQRLFRKKKHGMEVVALEILKELQQIDQFNEYVLFVKDDNDRNCINKTSNFQIELLQGKTYLDWEQFRLAKAVKKQNVDFLHSTCNTSAIKLSVPLLLTLHDIIYLEKIDFKGTAYQNFGNIYRRFVVPKVSQSAKYIITVSNFEREVIIDKLKIPEEKVKVVYNAVNKKFNNNYTAEAIGLFRSRHNLPNEFMLFLGNTAPKKNTKNVIDAYIKYCRSTSEIVPLVILDYDKALVEKQLEKSGNIDLLKHFLFPGFIVSDEMPLMYNAAKIFLYPSLRESFGLPLLEAMGCGTPVITSNTSSMPEVGGNAAIYVNPYNIDDISEAMAQLLTDEQQRSSLIQKGIERAGVFNWRKSASDLLAIYNEM